MFHRMFGRPKTRPTDESPTDPGSEETEERSELVSSDGFVFIGGFSSSYF